MPLVHGSIDDAPAWAYRGFVGRATPPACVATHERDELLVIVGCARHVWDDLNHIPPSAHRMAVNHIGLYLDHVDHWASLHADMAVLFNQARFLEGCEWAKHTSIHARANYTNLHEAPHAFIWEFSDEHSRTSGLFATLVGLCLGYQHVLLAGIPMDNSGNFHGPWDGSGWKHSNEHERAQWVRWRLNNPEFARCVRSLSGWTRDLLGDTF